MARRLPLDHEIVAAVETFSSARFVDVICHLDVHWTLHHALHDRLDVLVAAGVLDVDGPRPVGRYLVPDQNEVESTVSAA